jgi:N-succinyldiaminopimelate aminotransferase
MAPHAAERIRGFPATIFSEFSALALKHGAVNLGQGFPDFDGPEEVLEAAKRAIDSGQNQYAVGAGALDLRRAIAEHSERFYAQRVDPDTMVTVTSGATEALMDAVLALVDPGDEVILFEPFYDSYPACVAMAGGRARYVTLHPPDASHPAWWFDEGALAAAFTGRTKLLVLNTPHNPTGKVYSKDELSLIAKLCRQNDVVALVDEVYEHIVFEPGRHLRLSTMDGMPGRTLTVSSGGKTFSTTGWKVGWAMGPPPLRQAVQQAHQFVTFATAAPFQAAIAAALRLPDAYFAKLAQDYRQRRDLTLGLLKAAGVDGLCPEGSYFILADVARFGFPTDDAFCRALTEQVRVAAIPLSPFVAQDSPLRARCLARFAFCKKDETLRAAGQRLLDASREGASALRGAGPRYNGSSR